MTEKRRRRGCVCQLVIYDMNVFGYIWMSLLAVISKLQAISMIESKILDVEHCSGIAIGKLI